MSEYLNPSAIFLQTKQPEIFLSNERQMFMWEHKCSLQSDQKRVINLPAREKSLSTDVQQCEWVWDYSNIIGSSCVKELLKQNTLKDVNNYKKTWLDYNKIQNVSSSLCDYICSDVLANKCCSSMQHILSTPLIMK